MIHTLDIYQQEALSKIKKSNLILLQGNRYSGKSYLIRYYLNELWSSGQMSIVVVPDKEYAEMFLKHLGAFGLSEFAFILDDNFINSKKFESKINYLLNTENITVSKKDILIKKLIFSKSLNKILNYYDILNTKFLNNKTLSELIIINSFDKRAFENIYFNQIIDPDKFTFDQQEYNNLKENIKKAFELQLKGENQTDNYFSLKNYTGDDPIKAWEHIKTWIHESRIETLNAIQFISGFMQKQSSLQFEKIWQKTKIILTDIENLIFKIETFNIQYDGFDNDQINFLGLDRKFKKRKEEYSLAIQKIVLEYKKIIDELNKIQIIHQDYIFPKRDESQIEIILDSLKKILNDRKQLEKIILNSIKKELKSMNFRNIKNDATIPLEEQLKKLFSILNNNFVKTKWEDNAFSINKQLDFLENLLHDLNNLENQKNTFIKNYKWNKFTNALDPKSLYIINILNTYQPKNWLIFFKNWFIQNIILKYKYYLVDNINEELTNILKKDESYQDIIYKKSLKIWHNKRDILLSKHNSEIDNFTGLKKENSDIFLINNISIYSALFPITIVIADVYENIEQGIEEIFDLTVFEGADFYKSHFNRVYDKFKSKKNIIVLDDDESNTEINKQLLNYDRSLNVEKQILNGFHQQGMINLVDMNLTERLYAARNIAHLMISGNKNIKIYLMKGIVLFSAFDDFLNQVLVKILESKGIKETKIIDTPFHSLVDNILEFNNKQIFLIQNNLIDYKNTSNIIWQLKALEKIKKSGIKIVNFNINILLEDPVKRTKEFVQKNIL